MSQFKVGDRVRIKKEYNAWLSEGCKSIVWDVVRISGVLISVSTDNSRATTFFSDVLELDKEDIPWD